MAGLRGARLVSLERMNSERKIELDLSLDADFREIEKEKAGLKKKSSHYFSEFEARRVFGRSVFFRNCYKKASRVTEVTKRALCPQGICSSEKRGASSLQGTGFAQTYGFFRGLIKSRVENFSFCLFQSIDEYPPIGELYLASTR